MVTLSQVISGLAANREEYPSKEETISVSNYTTTITGPLTGQDSEVRGTLNIEVSGICYDSRKVEKGSIFVCIPGLKADGHDYAAKAVGLGASVLVVERFLDLPVTQIKVKNARLALGLLVASFYQWPADKLRVIGVTGTNGKTTTTHLIEYILNKSGHRAGLIGTLGAKIGAAEFPGSRTTPEASDLQGLLAEMVRSDVEYAVMEVSSHALDLHRVAGCEYDVAVFTNLTQDHLDYHQNMQEYLAAKAKLFQTLGKDVRKNGKKYAVINADDPVAAELSALTSAKTVTYGLDEKADYQAENVLNRPGGVEFEIVYPGGREKVKMKTPGMFTVYNTLAAFAVGIEEGLKSEAVVNTLAEIKGVPGRFELVEGEQPFSVIVDYAHTPDSLENVLKTAREFVTGQIITVFGCGGDRDRTKRPIMGEIAGRLSDLSIVTSDNPRSEEPLVIIDDIKKGFRNINYITEVDRRDAIMLACSKAKGGDMILIAGKGHEDYQEIKGEKLPFDDRVVAKECLGRLGYVANS